MAATPRFLLLQARNPRDPVREEERQAFVAATGLPDEAIVAYDLLQGPPPPQVWRQYDGLFVGGSGEYNLSDGSCPQPEATRNFLLEVIAARVPMFASCFGFQMLAVALGGRVERDVARAEIGTFEITLTAQGLRDDLFGQLPPRFWAQLGHKEHVTLFPHGQARLLARSERSPYQALRIPNAPIWATQFHPELDQERNLARLLRYRDLYVQHLGPEGFQQLLQQFRPSPVTDELLPRFLYLVFGWLGPRWKGNHRHRLGSDTP